MRKSLMTAVLLLALPLAGCAGSRSMQLGDTMPGVTKIGNGLYTVTEMNIMHADPFQLAANQCIFDGNKKMNIVGSTTTKGMYSGADYARIVFRCD